MCEMVKVVYNACYGGFSLSEAGVRRYAELKGIEVYPEKNGLPFTTYWTVPPEKRKRVIPSKEWGRATAAERERSNAAYMEQTLRDREIPRTDPCLVQVVEELGDAANGDCAHLRIEEVPKGARYRIDEYDGRESVRTASDYEWEIA